MGLTWFCGLWKVEIKTESFFIWLNNVIGNRLIKMLLCVQLFSNPLIQRKFWIHQAHFRSLNSHNHVVNHQSYSKHARISHYIFTPMLKWDFHFMLTRCAFHELFFLISLFSIAFRVSQIRTSHESMFHHARSYDIILNKISLSKVVVLISLSRAWSLHMYHLNHAATTCTEIRNVYTSTLMVNFIKWPLIKEWGTYSPTDTRSRFPFFRFTFLFGWAYSV